MSSRKIKGSHKKMLCNVTVSGTSIPQDPEGNDMCLLFVKYGRCRFKLKCKKSHWVPPLPDEPCPAAAKPPLPGEMTHHGRTSQSLFVDIRHSYPKTFMPIHTEACLVYSYPSTQNVELDNLYDIIPPLPTVVTAPGVQQSETKPSKKKTPVMQRRFKHIFHDNDICSSGCSGIEIMFREANVYYDRIQQKVMPVNPSQNKADKHHLKLIRRLHWNYSQQLKEKLSQFPPSFHLKFDRNKVNFNRLRPYIYVLIHECLCPDGLAKPVKPSKLAYLVADTLIVHLEMKHITAKEAELKLQEWGARAVRARQCIDHLWHLISVCSKRSEGCVGEILDIEEDVLKNSRTSLDYAYACRFALKRNSNHFPRRVCSAVKQGLRAQRKASQRLNEQNLSERNTGLDKQASYKANVLPGKTQKKRKRSRQFKNVSLSEKKKIETRCVELLTTLSQNI